jgi:hypothetical protein
MCLSSGFSCQTSPTFDWESSNPCTRSTWASTYVSYLYLDSNTPSVLTGTTGLYMGLNAKGVSIRWNPNAAVTSSTNQTSSTSSESSTSTGCSSTSGSCHKGVSGGKIAGAVVGSVVGLVLLVTAVFAILVARRRRRESARRSYEVKEKRAEDIDPNRPREVAGEGVVEIGPGKGYQANPPSYAQELP